MAVSLSVANVDGEGGAAVAPGFHPEEEAGVKLRQSTEPTAPHAANESTY